VILPSISSSPTGRSVVWERVRRKRPARALRTAHCALRTSYFYRVEMIGRSVRVNETELHLVYYYAGQTQPGRLIRARGGARRPLKPEDYCKKIGEVPGRNLVGTGLLSLNRLL
jgi:hypothetical protein